MGKVGRGERDGLVWGRDWLGVGGLRELVNWGKFGNWMGVGDWLVERVGLVGWNLSEGWVGVGLKRSWSEVWWCTKWIW